MALYDVPAPAKLNLFLHVTGRRSDGYHELQTVFRFIDLCDTLDFDLRRDGEIRREGESLPGLLPEQDLVIRAARALQQATGTKLGAQVRYTKRIPSGAGLGGGSSDAATTLIALNRLWNTGLDREALLQLARPLGADVPVFVFGRAAFAEGTGDILTEVAVPERAYLILQPEGAVPTAQIFSSPDLTRDTEPVIISFFADWQTDQTQEKHRGPGGLLESELSGNLFFGRNDLQPVVLKQYEAIRQLAEALQKQGFHARMTGSGSCFFVEFNTQEQAFRAQQKISSIMLGGKSEMQVSGQYDASAIHQRPRAVVKDSWVCSGLSDHPLRYW